MTRLLGALLPMALMLACAGRSASPGPTPYTGLKTRIETSDYERCLAFYTEILGLPVLESWDEAGDRGAILGLPGSASPEAFLEIAAAADAPPLSGVSLQLRVRDLAPIVARLRDRWEFRGPTKRPWGSTYLYLTDPAGVAIIVFEGDL